MSQKGYRVAIVGATGMVGEAMRTILEERSFPVSSLRLLASARSLGRRLAFRGETFPVEELKEDSFSGIDIALFSAGGSISSEFVPAAVKSGAVCIDNTSAFRMDDQVPLVVPEVNPDDLNWHQGIIANPNCSTIQMVVVLKPIHDAVSIRRIVVSTYQAVSGAGKEAVDELLTQSKAMLNGEQPEPEIFSKQIAFNCLPHIDVFLDNGSTKEEAKMVHETKKIMGDQNIQVSATCVRVPVITGHSESVNIHTEHRLTAEEARELLSRAPGITIMDNPGSLAYPTAINAVGRDQTLVGRIREDESIPNGLNLWIVSDNLRKGAALNAVQIAEILVDKGLL